MKCNNCNYENPNNNQFCVKCGTKLEQKKSIFCSKCGTENNINNLYCTKCGNTLKKEVNINQNIKIEPIIQQSNNIQNNETKTVIQQVTNNQNMANANQTVINQTTNNTKKSNNKLKIILPIVAVCAVFIIFISILLTNVTGNKSLKGGTRTIMIYMVGSNLETRHGLATYDLNGLDYNKITANGNKVYLMAGGTTSWKNNYIDVNSTSIYELKENGFEIVEKRPLDNMGDSLNLEYFLTYVYNNSKTDKYDFMYWNHGGAVDGSDFDDIKDDHIDLLDMKEAFGNSPFNKKNKLEVISFRTCLNSTVEIANINKEFADYMVASEESTLGAPFGSALEFINNIKKSDNAIDYGKKQIEGYKSYLSNLCNEITYQNIEENYCENSTYALINLNKIEKVRENFVKFSRDLNNNINNKNNEMLRIRANLNQYGQDEKAFDMVDLYNLSEKYSNYSSNSTKLQKSIEDAVEYNWSNNDYSHGLSVYYPYNESVFIQEYKDFSPSDEYTTYINNIYNYKKTASNKANFSDFSKTEARVKDVKKDKATITMELSEEQSKSFSVADYLIFTNSNDNDGLYNFVYKGQDVKLDNNVLKANIEGKLLKVRDIEYDDFSMWIQGIEKESNSKYTDIETTAIINNSAFDLQAVTLTIRIDKKHPNGYIKSVHSIEKSETKKEGNSQNFATPVSKVGINIKDYVGIKFFGQSYQILDSNKNYNPNWTSTGNGTYQGYEYLTDEFTFEAADFTKNKEFYAVIRVKDTSNNVYYSKPIRIGE